MLQLDGGLAQTSHSRAEAQRGRNCSPGVALAQREAARKNELNQVTDHAWWKGPSWAHAQVPGAPGRLRRSATPVHQLAASAVGWLEGCRRRGGSPGWPGKELRGKV